MLQRWIGELKKTPERLSRTGHELGARVHRARESGEERLWTLQTSALERAEAALGRAPEVPVVGRVADAAERLVSRRLGSLTAVAITDYDQRNSRSAIDAVKGLDRRVQLLAVRRHEAATKNRKTVLRAVDERLEILGHGPRSSRREQPRPTAPADVELASAEPAGIGQT